MLQLELLGHPKVRLDGELLQIPSSKSQALFFYLALNERPFTRSALAGLLWGGKTESNARRNLRVELTKLRRHLGRYLVVSHSTVGFDHGQRHWLDVSELRVVARDIDVNFAQAKWAANLVRGELLEDLQLRDAPEFETWLLGEREDCQRLYRTLLQAVVRRCQTDGLHEEALEYARRLLNAEPWQEESHRQVIRLLAQLGQWSAALAQFESCRMMLAEELGIEPSQETMELIVDIKEGRVAVLPDVTTVTTVMQPNHNLPASTTSFVGRRRELAQIRELLSQPDCRLLTLLGPGGIGKSRMALEVGRSWVINPRPNFVDGIYFVPLEAADSESSMITAVTAALEMNLAGSETLKNQLLRHLKDKRILLILDNFEQLLPNSGFLLEIISAAENVKCLVTSRQRLELMETWNLDLQGLEIPKADDTGAAESFSAVNLFTDRARRLDLSFDSKRELEGIMRICRLVDGLPLGIELASAWVRGFTCSQIADRIGSDLDFLQLSSPSLPERQRSLRAAFKHSWDLLQKNEQDVFAGLTIFRGGFTGDSAVELTESHTRLVLNLVDKSLLRRTPLGRFELHEVLCQLAREKLSPQQYEDLEVRHALIFGNYLKRLEPGRSEILAQEQLEDIAVELTNIRAAWNWSVASQNSKIINLAAITLALYYIKRGYFTEGAEQFSRASQAVPAGSHLWAILQQRRAQFAFRLGQNENAIELGTVALEVFESEGDTLEQARSHLNLGNVVRDMGNHETARDHFLKSAESFSEMEDQLGLANVENNLGVISYYEEDLTGAIDHFKAAYQARRSAGVADTTMELGNIGLCLGDLGRYEEAAEYLEQSLAQSQKLNDRLAMGLAYHNLGNVRRKQGQYQIAAKQIEDGVRLFRDLDSRDALAAALADLASTYLSLGNFQSAEEALLEGLTLERALGRPRGIAYKHLGLGNLRLEQGEFDQAFGEFKQVLDIADEEHGPSLLLGALTGLAVIRVNQGDPEIGTKLLSSIITHPQATSELKDQIHDWSHKLNLDLVQAVEREQIDVQEMVDMLDIR